jgi:deaminated glutathione amidase
MSQEVPVTGTQTKFKAAMVQMRTTLSVEKNIADASKLIREAKDMGAEYIQTPEMTNIMEQGRDGLFAQLKEEERDDALAAFRQLARDLKTHVHIGSLAIKVSDDKAANRSFLIDREGEIVTRYDKIHLFDVDIPGRQEKYRESSTTAAGTQAVVAMTPLGHLGMAVCYDVRFPELFRTLQARGAEILSLPSAFTAPTGKAHWELLVRARAVENLCYMLAPAQGGMHANGRETHGDSMIVDPWGHVMARVVEAGPGLAVAEIDRTLQQEMRTRFPALSHRRFELSDAPR